MAKTQIADIIIPTEFERYVIERTAEISAFWESGIVGTDPVFDAAAAKGGKVVELPFWQDLAGDDEILSDTNALTPGKITASQDTARIHNRAKAWSSTLLAELLAGDDPMEAIIQLVGDYWARRMESMLISSVKGVLAEFDSEAGDPNLLKILSESIDLTTAATSMNGLTMIDAKQKLGDRKNRLTAVAMHSAVEADLLKNDLIDFIPDSEGKAMLPVFQGLRVVVDDSLASRAGTTNGVVYTSVLFGAGAFAQGNAPLTDPIRGGASGTEGVEFGRVTLNSDDILVNRRRFILHPRGVRWLEQNIAEHGGPSNAELEEAAQWDMVFEPKNIRIVGVHHNLNSQIEAGS